MLDLQEQLTQLIDIAPPVTATEARARARRRRRRDGALAGVVAAMLLVTAIGIARSERETSRLTVASSSTTAHAPRTRFGSSVGQLEIPKIGLSQVVVEGATVETLRKGPAHDPASGLPGDDSHVVITGHTTTWSHPFFQLDELRAGDRVVVTTDAGAFAYAVERVFVDPAAWSPREQTFTPWRGRGAELVLLAPSPRYSATDTLVVICRPEDR